jgi:hypothetical protein
MFITEGVEDEVVFCYECVSVSGYPFSVCRLLYTAEKDSAVIKKAIASCDVHCCVWANAFIEKDDWCILKKLRF